jgi:AGZA family xanthine/uracil permease-like MFS transporter
VISYVVTHAIAGRYKEISVPMWVLSVLFVLRYIFI